MKLLVALGFGAAAFFTALTDGSQTETGTNGTTQTAQSDCAVGGSCCANEAAGEKTLASAIKVPTMPALSYNPDETGTIKGTVKFGGERPEPLPALSIGADKAEGCVADMKDLDKTDRKVMIDKMGRVANVVVMVEVKGAKMEPLKEPVVLDQKGCRFEPHVVVVPVGSKIKYVNSDSVNHNVHTYAKKNRTMNNNVAGGSSEEQLLEKDEVIEVKCDIHPWMNAYVVVSESMHYAVTAPDGSYSLPGLPPGEYKVEYWHETLGKGKTDEVTITAGGTAAMDFKVGGDEGSSSGGRGRGRGKRGK